jgi:Tol biopolymer transport system component
MFASICRHPMLRLFRSIFPRLVVAAGVIAVNACDGADNPLGPTASDDPLGSAGESAAPVNPLAAVTAPRIAFTSYRYNDHPNLYLMDAQGNNIVRLTGWTSDAGSPAWSSDHKHVALVRARLDATNTRHEDIYLIDADGSHKHWARSSPSSFNITDPSWSPDGSRLVVTVVLQGKPYLATLDLATGNTAFVWGDGNLVEGREPSYDATGERIVYVGNGGKSVNWIYNGWVYGAVGSQTIVASPSLSPDGKKILYTGLVNNTNPEIFVYTPSISSTKRLTYSAGSDGEATWSPDGSKIAFVSHRSGQFQIWTMSATGGTATRITHTSSIETSPAWSQ